MTRLFHSQALEAQSYGERSTWRGAGAFGHGIQPGLHSLSGDNWED